ncbi:MAG: ATP-binding protein [Desulfitobacterium hafniense]|nr:ATP-binding protein [Desulfitobacterium hafniense]
MARGDLLKKLLVAYNRGEDKAFKEISMEIIKDERKKNHNVLADQLQRILYSEHSTNRMFRDFTSLALVPKDDDEVPLIEIRKSNKYLDDLIISKDNKTILNQILEEYWNSERIKSYNLRPKLKLLFCGPPGCGKTLTAEVLAGELGLPIVYNRFDSIISSYLGDTASNIRKVFDFAKKDTWVLLFDEFDAIGKSRNDPNEHGELKRVVNSFLQILDSFVSNSLVIACTNHEGMLDTAIWRRFDEVIYFGPPSDDDIPLLIRKKTLGFHLGEINVENYIDQLSGFTHADIERICHEAIKACILKDKDYLTEDVFSQTIRNQRRRLDIYRNEG